MQLYTIGEIFRLGLLKNHKGNPYSDKATVSRIVSRLNPVEKITPWGMAKYLSEEQINAFNESNTYENNEKRPPATHTTENSRPS